MDYTRKSYFTEQHPHHHHLNTSFSSSLLDEIYKSFDETTTCKSSASFEETTTKIMRKKMSTQTCIAPVTTTGRTSSNKHQSNGGSAGGVIRGFAVKEESAGRVKQRNVVDKWGLEEKKKNGNEKQVVENNYKINQRKNPASVPVDTHRYFHSTSSSSDSSSGGGFSSSETESVYGSKTTPSTKSATKSASASFFVKPIRTRGSSTVHHSEKTDQILRNQSKSNGGESRSGGGNGKAKSRAMKIYNDLIKVKQPISPGGKISSFLNSLFTPKKSSNLVDNNDFPATTKSTFTRTAPPVAAAATPTCSSASSYSRSCLSKTPSLANGKPRSVRFYPVNIIVNEKHQESKPSREQSHRHHYQQRSEEEYKNKISTVRNSNPRFLVEEVIDIDKLLMRNHQRTDHNLKVLDDEDDYDDDRASDASSDLFELENLSTIGLENAVARFSEELPVYETTHFQTNRAIANGFRL